MQISARAEYAVRAVTYLAIHDGGLSQISNIAADEGIPSKFLEHILLELKKAGIVTSKRGVGGGYCLVRPTEKITVGEVVRVFDGSLGPVGGIKRMRSGDDLTEAEHCLRPTWLKVANAISKVMDGASFASVAAERRHNVALAAQTISHGTAWF
ncbi:MAG: Rrf2 family transcriptional regulator [Actinobacteria bacterium]|nr:Rrf2 family transcriptional regulator [Actinomycetota bacterium]